jgi:hypothetical protein
VTIAGIAPVSVARGEEGASSRTEHAAASDFAVHAAWGQLVSSQLDRETPTAYWNVGAELPLIDPIGLRTKLRMDSIVFGQPGQALSQMVHPGRTDYSIALRLFPPRSWIGFEIHHVSSHEVASLHGAETIDFEQTIDRGGASNYISLLLHTRGMEARLGVGGQWSDTNTAPILLALDGILLNSRIAQGPFASLRVPIGPRAGIRGHLTALYVHDEVRDHPQDADSLTWGATLFRPMHRRVHLGITYAGNNGVPGLKRADNSIAAFLRLRWTVDG